MIGLRIFAEREMCIRDSSKGYTFINNVVLCNLLDRDFFQDSYQKSNLLKEYEKLGKRFFPSFQYLMEDLFYLLYKMALTLKEEEEISSEVKPHLIFLRKILFTNHTKKLRRRTKGNIVHTYHAMNFYILWILKFLENEEISQLFRERSGLLEEIREIEMELFKEERKKNQLEGNDQDESGDMGDGKEEPSSTQKGLSLSLIHI